MASLLGDLRYAVRQLVRGPGFTASAVLALGLGIGGATAMFSVIDGVLLRPLPYREADRLALITEKADRLQLPQMWVSLPNFNDWAERNRSFEALAAFGAGEVGLSGAGEPERLHVAWVIGPILEILRVQLALGRTFEPAEAIAGGPRSLILTDGLWRRRFGADPAVLGRTVRLDGESFTIVGIAPSGFRFPEVTGSSVQALISFAAVIDTDADMAQRTSHPGLVAIGRLRPGVSVDDARADLNAVAAELRRQYPDNIDDGVWLAALKGAIVEDARTPLLILLAAVGLLLLIACANVACLLLARGAWRERELALRAALGAGPRRLVGQLLTESLLLSLIGGTCGLLLATWGLAALIGIHPGSVPRVDEIRLNLPVLAVALTLATVTAVLSGIVPAWFVRRADLAAGLRGGTEATSGMRRQRLRRLLVAGELGLAIVLLTGAGLLLRSLQQVLRVDPGFDARGVFLVEISLPTRRYPTAARQAQFFEELAGRVAGVPGVAAAGFVTDPPLSGSSRQSGLQIAGAPPLEDGQAGPLTDIESVSPGYFATMGIRLRAGRLLEPADDENARRVTVIDNALARRFFPGASPIGRRIAFDQDASGAPAWREIVGVVETVKRSAPDAMGRDLMYIPARQEPVAEMTLAVRAAGDPAAVAELVRGAIRSVDRELPASDPRVLEELVAGSLAPRRLHALLLTMFAGTALLLASLGTYGVVSFSAARRTREIGIRVALGASRRQVLFLLSREGVILLVAAAIVGIPAALALARALRSQLFGVSPADPWTLGAIVTVLAVVAFTASYLPARRVARSDPVLALRSE